MEFQEWWTAYADAAAREAGQSDEPPTPETLASTLYHALQRQRWERTPTPTWVADAIETYRVRIWPLIERYKPTMQASDTPRAPDRENEIVDLQAESMSPASHTKDWAASASVQFTETVVLELAGFPQSVTLYTANGLRDDRLTDGLAVLHYCLASIETRSADNDADIVQRLAAGLEASHTIWQAVDNDGLKHPVAVLIDAWVNDRPVPVETDDRKTGIAPATLARASAAYIKTGRSDMGALFDVSEFERAPASMTHPTVQAFLPGLEPVKSAIITPLPFLIWDGNDRENRGRGAPYGLRMWVEAVLSVPVAARKRASLITVRWRDMVDAALGRTGEKGQQQRLLAALDDVHNLRIAYGEPGARMVRAAVMVQDRPETWNDYDGFVRMVVELPPGSGSGPLVYKPFLHEIARQSAAAYRAALGLCYLWDRHGATRGRYIQPTRPRLARNGDGLLIGGDGAILTGKDGNPIRKYMTGQGGNRRLRTDVVALDTDGNRVYSVAQADRERNPSADKYPILSAADLVKLCYPAYPTSQPSTMKVRRHRAKEVISQMADRDYFMIEEVDGGWRILPPQGWGAKFGE